MTRHLTPINDARRRAAMLVGCLLVVAVAALPSAGRASTKVTPAVFQEVSTGVALIKTYKCDGRGIAQGTGFLVGESVVMTARHVLQGACRVSVRVNGDAFVGQRWVRWSGGQASFAAADLGTIKLDHEATGAYVFRIRSSSPPLGTNLGMVGYPLGNRLSLNQGKLAWRGFWRDTRSGAPLLGVKMLGAEGASGAPFTDDAGRVVGILQDGLGSKDVLGQRTAGALVGLDLVRWWGPRARLDLCRAYPKGGIAGCPTATPTPTPTPKPAPTPTPAPVPAYSIRSCWVQYTAGSWLNITPTSASTVFAAGDLIARGPANFWSIVELTAGAPSTITGVNTYLIEPTGQVSNPNPVGDVSAGTYRVTNSLAWLRGGGSPFYFFQTPYFPLGSRWAIRWVFPNGQSCDTPFTVT